MLLEKKHIIAQCCLKGDRNAGLLDQLVQKGVINAAPEPDNPSMDPNPGEPMP